MRTMKVKALTNEQYSYTFFNVQTCADTTHCITTTNYQVDTGYHEVTTTTEFQGYLKTWNVQFSNTGNGWTANKTYTIKVGLGVNSPENVADNKKSLYSIMTGYETPRFYMYGNTTTSANEGVSNKYIQSYSCSITPNDNAVNRIYLNCTFIPTQTIKYFKATIMYNKLNDNIQFAKYGYMTMDSFTSTEDVSGVINNQTNVIQNGFNQTNQIIEGIINEDKEYNTEGRPITGGQGVQDMENLENDIMGQLDFSGKDNLEVNIDSNTSNFIWEIANQIRQLNQKILLLITSMLGLGVIKMILNR